MGPQSSCCAACKAKGTLVTEGKVVRLPAVFIVHIHRADRTGERLNDAIEFPADNLDLRECLLEPDDPRDHGMNRCPSVYSLQAVVFHQGRSAISGHYFALVRNQCSSTASRSQWVELNDMYCAPSEMDPQTVETTFSGPRAALLFYVRNDKNGPE